MTNPLPDPNDWRGNAWRAKHAHDVGDGSLYRALKIPECLHDVMDFAGAKFAPKNKDGVLALGLWPPEKITDPTNWVLTLPTNVPGKRVEIPINDPIDQSDPEGHWRAILAAAADFQALVNSGEYKPV